MIFCRDCRTLLVTTINEHFDFSIMDAGETHYKTDYGNTYRVKYFFIVVFTGLLSVLDPPGHLFRIRLICTLLDTCGQYFDHGNYKKKLDCYLLYFQVS